MIRKLINAEFYSFIDFSNVYLERAKSFSSPREIFFDQVFLSANHSCIVGEKGIGKTVLACQKALEKLPQEKILYTSLDHTLFAARTMTQIAKSAAEAGIELVIFDEIHRYPDWKHDLKEVCDTIQIKTIVSGSSILSFQDLGGLARRFVKYHLKGMSLREYFNLRYRLNMTPVSLSEVCNGSQAIGLELKKTIEESTQQKLGKLFEEYLKRGYYIYSFDEPVDSNFFARLLQSTEDTIAYEIVTAQTHSRPDMARRLQAIFKAVSKNVPYQINYDDLKTYSGVSDIRTLKHYIECLIAAGIIRYLYRSSLKGLKKPEKLYLGNPCLYYAYANLQPNVGSIRETFFLNAADLAGLEVLSSPKAGDFKIKDWVFEVGGPNKSKKQIKGINKAFVVKDSVEPTSDPQVIPLWLFGFLN